MGCRLRTLDTVVGGQNIIARNSDLAEHQLICPRILYRYVLCGTSRSQILGREIEACWCNLSRRPARRVRRLIGARKCLKESVLYAFDRLCGEAYRGAILGNRAQLP